MTIQTQNPLQVVRGAIRTSNTESELRSKLTALGVENLSGLQIHRKDHPVQGFECMKSGHSVSFRGRVPRVFEIIGDAGATESRTIEWSNVII